MNFYPWGPQYFCEYAEDPCLVTGRKMISSDNIPLAPEELITALYLAVSVMLAWVQSTGKEKVVLLWGTFYSLLGKVNMTQCQEEKFFIQIKRMNIRLRLLIVITHLMVLLYSVLLRSSNYFRKSDFLKPDLL